MKQIVAAIMIAWTATMVHWTRTRVAVGCITTIQNGVVNMTMRIFQPMKCVVLALNMIVNNALKNWNIMAGVETRTFTNLNK
jgi:hypothetical protein